jgi:hypothetical protein
MRKSSKQKQEITWEYPKTTDKEVRKDFLSKAHTTKKTKSKEGLIKLKAKKKVKPGRIKVKVSLDKMFHKFIESHPKLKVLEKGKEHSVVLVKRALNIQVGFNQDGFQPHEFINQEMHYIANILAWGSLGKKVGEIAEYLLKPDAIVNGLVYHVMSTDEIEKWIDRKPKVGMF